MKILWLLLTIIILLSLSCVQNREIQWINDNEIVLNGEVYKAYIPNAHQVCFAIPENYIGMANGQAFYDLKYDQNQDFICTQPYNYITVFAKTSVPEVGKNITAIFINGYAQSIIIDSKKIALLSALKDIEIDEKYRINERGSNGITLTGCWDGLPIGTYPMGSVRYLYSRNIFVYISMEKLGEAFAIVDDPYSENLEVYGAKISDFNTIQLLSNLLIVE